MAKNTGAEKATIREVVVKTAELVPLANLLTKVVPKKGNIENTKNLVRLTRVLKAKVEEYFEQQKLLFASYGIELEGDTYKWEGHKDKKEIDAKVEEFNKSTVTLIPANFMSEQEFYETVEAFQAGQIEFLEKVLSENPV